MNGLKKRLDDVKGKWAEELHSVLWAYRTTPRRSTGEIFSLMYGAEAVIPTKVNLCNARVEGFNPDQNEGMMVEHLDLLEEYREAATIRLDEYQQGLARCYNQDVKTKGIRCWGLGATESSKEHARHECQETSPYLGRAL